MNAQVKNFTLDNTVKQEEIDFMLSKCNNLQSLDQKQLHVEYPKAKADLMVHLFTVKRPDFAPFAPCLNWYGIGTRFESFYQFLESQQQLPSDAKDAFIKFANHLGRVHSHRALALEPHVFQSEVIANNMIRPKGRLTASEQEIDAIIKQHGITTICHERLYYTHAIPHDPSVSLHDDGETATCIANTFVKSFNTRRIYLMEMSVPIVETAGIVIKDVQVKGAKRWFEYHGVYFDSHDQTTERYVLYGIPMYKERLVKLTVFDSREKVNEYLTPFAAKQLEKMKANPN